MLIGSIYNGTPPLLAKMRSKWAVINGTYFLVLYEYSYFKEKCNPYTRCSYCHKCFCIETCFACSLFRPSVAIRGLPQDMAVPSRCRRRDSPGKMKIKKTDVSSQTENLLIISKSFPNRYDRLVVLPDEFDFSASR